MWDRFRSGFPGDVQAKYGPEALSVIGTGQLVTAEFYGRASWKLLEPGKSRRHSGIEKIRKETVHSQPKAKKRLLRRIMRVLTGAGRSSG